MKNVLWEQTSNGSPARLSKPPRLKRSGLLLKRVAVAKMVEVSLISAEFDGIPVVFEPKVEVFLDEGSAAGFMGVYQSGYPSDEEYKELPSLCLRISRWNRNSDFRQFNEAQDKKHYIESDKQVKSQILFTTLKADSEIDELTTEIIDIFRRGVALEAVNRTQERWHEIRCKVVDDAAAYTVSYTPFSAKNERVERWITKWRSYFQQVSTKKQVPSDNGCRVSYNLSLRERLAI